MKLDWMNEFKDPYYQTPGGKGAFLSGIVLGQIARGQAGTSSIDTSPMFKQLTFGRLQKRDVQRHLSRVPELLKAYGIKYDGYMNQLTVKAGEFLIQDNSEFGIDGNFAFSLAFLNSREYFWTIFGKDKTETEDSEKVNESD